MIKFLLSKSVHKLFKNYVDNFPHLTNFVQVYTTNTIEILSQQGNDQFYCNFALVKFYSLGVSARK